MTFSNSMSAIAERRGPGRGAAHRLALPVMLAAAIGAAGAVQGAEPVSPETMAVLLDGSDAERADAYRGLIAGALPNGADAPLDDDVLRWTIGFAATACNMGDERSALVTPEDGDWLQAVSDRAVQDDTASAAYRLEALIGVAQCLNAQGDSWAAGDLFRAAVDVAVLVDPSEEGASLRARIADAAALSDMLAPEEVFALLQGINAPAYEATIMRAWAISALHRWGEVPELPAVGAYEAPEFDNERLAELSAEALSQADMERAFQYAAAIEVSLTDLRTPLLESVSRLSTDMGDHATARLVARAIADSSLRSDWLQYSAERALSADLPADAEYAARLMEPTRNTINVWLDVAAAYRDAEYPEALIEALDRAEAIARGLLDEDDGSALMLVTGRAAQLDQTDRAAEILTEISEAEGRPRAIADLAKRLAELDDVSQALEWALLIDDPAIDAEIRTRALGPIAKRMAEMDRLDDARALIDLRPDLTGTYLDQALRTIAVGLARSGDVAAATSYVERIVDEEERARAMMEIGRVQGGAEFEELLEERTDAVIDIASTDQVQFAIEPILDVHVDRGDMAALEALSARLQGSGAMGGAVDQVKAAIARVLADRGDYGEAIAATEEIDDDGLRDRARGDVALVMAEGDDLPGAARLARSIRDYEARLVTFRIIAEMQAHRLDAYQLVPEIYASRPAGLSAQVIAAPAGNGAAPGDFVQERAGMAVFDVADAGMADWPELSGLSHRVADALTLVPADVRERVVAGSEEGLTVRLPITGTPYNEKYIEIVGVVDYAQRQGEMLPHLIYIEHGTYTISMLREALIGLGRADYLTVDGGVFTLHRPIVVGPRATLVISGADAKELRLSTDEYAYLVVGGRMVVADTVITSWGIEESAPSELVSGENDFNFRPFLIGWSGSEIYATRTNFRALGYNNRKSWGVSVSSGPQGFTFEGETVMESPKIVLVENLFDRLFYGFYSYNTHDIDIVGNEYRNNVIYGPDPHDYSESVLMALNTAYGTLKKHGLIVSREVSGLFVGNISFDNHGAGIMLDRLSNRSIIYGNTAWGNGNDGIAVYETACAIVANNQLSHNSLTGLRIRNSIDIAVFDNVMTQNDKEGVIIDTDPLLDHTWRDLEQDPFWTYASATLIGNHISGNVGAVRMEDVYAATFVDNRVAANGNSLLEGDFLPLLNLLVRQYPFESSSFMLADLCQQPLERHHGCPFREAGIFHGDGQDDWAFGGPAPTCEGTYSVSNIGVTWEPGS